MSGFIKKQEEEYVLNLNRHDLRTASGSAPETDGTAVAETNITNHKSLSEESTEKGDKDV